MSRHFLNILFSPRIASIAVISQGKKGGGTLRIEKRSGASTSITLFSVKLGSFRSSSYRSTGSIRSHCS
jgi:hypothetical protein